jgi:ABC-type multidrug transport system ATPase subunit
MLKAQELLLAQNIAKSYGNFQALSDVSIDIQQSEIHSLLGPNGAGKTTLVKILATLLQKDTGRVQIDGLDTESHENEVRKIIGYVGQDTERSAYARLSIRENLMFFARIRGMNREHVSDWIVKLSKIFGLEDKIDCQFGHLSGGQKQSAIIMRGLLHDPLLLFLDEPTKGLDPLAARRIREYLKNYVVKMKRSILLTSHILSEVEFLSDRVSLLYKGHLGITGNPEELIDSIGSPEIVCLRKIKLTPNIVDKLLAQDAIMLSLDLGDDWIGFGIEDTFEGLESILRVLRKVGVKSEIQHRRVSLEDAFIHFLGNPGERFDTGKAA